MRLVSRYERGGRTTAYVGENAALRDGDVSKEAIELIVISNGELDMLPQFRTVSFQLQRHSGERLDEREGRCAVFGRSLRL